MPRKKLVRNSSNVRSDNTMLFDYLRTDLTTPPEAFHKVHIDLSRYESFDISKRTIYERALIGTDMVISMLYRTMDWRKSRKDRSQKPRAKATLKKLTYIYHEVRFRTWLSTQIDYLKELEAVEFIKQKNKEESKPVKPKRGRPKKKPIEPSPLSAEMERMVERMVEKYKSQPFNQTEQNKEEQTT